MIQKSRIVAVLGKDAEKYVQAAGDADMIELRLDLLDADDPLQTIEAVRKATAKPIIATARLRTEGGMFQGSERERIDLLIKAAYYADYVDLELLADQRDNAIARITKPVIVSYHDFRGMPDDLQLTGIYEEMKKTKAAIAKIAVTPLSLKDNLRILQFLLDADMPLCMIAMGRMGRHLRVVAPLYGSALTYGFVTQSTAPGQMSLAEICLARKLLEND
ncbi:MAG: type I 3-dehydroquinate dehydratase [Methanothrix sp.]|jgi:3-dehydroquinate dehydratase-1|nr:type I 3-dehydroquinate dehydratase [Methanothrix sp.]